MDNRKRMLIVGDIEVGGGSAAELYRRTLVQQRLAQRSTKIRRKLSGDGAERMMGASRVSWQ